MADLKYITGYSKKGYMAGFVPQWEIDIMKEHGKLLYDESGNVIAVKITWKAWTFMHIKLLYLIIKNVLDLVNPFK